VTACRNSRNTQFARWKRAAAAHNLGGVRIGCSPLLPLPRLQAILGALLLELPEVVPQVAHLRTSEQVRRLHQGHLQLGLVEAVVGTELESELVFPGDPLGAVLPFYHPLGRERVVNAGSGRPDASAVPPPRGPRFA